MAEKRIVGLQVTQRAVRGAQLKNTTAKKPIIEAWGEVELPHGVTRDSEVIDGAAVSVALRQLWDKAGFGTKNVALAVTNRRTFVREYTAPMLPLDQIKRTLPYQIEDILPVPADQMVLDFYPLGVSDNPSRQGIDGLVVASITDAIDGLVDAVHAAKLHISGIDLGAFGIARAAAQFVQPGSISLVVYIGAHLSQVLVLWNGIPHFIRILPSGLRDAIFPTGNQVQREMEDELARVGQGHDVLSGLLEKRSRRGAHAGGLHPDELRRLQEARSVVVPGAASTEVEPTPEQSGSESAERKTPVPVESPLHTTTAIPLQDDEPEPYRLDVETTPTPAARIPSETPVGATLFDALLSSRPESGSVKTQDGLPSSALPAVVSEPATPVAPAASAAPVASVSSEVPVTPVAPAAPHSPAPTGPTLAAPHSPPATPVATPAPAAPQKPASRPSVPSTGAWADLLISSIPEETRNTGPVAAVRPLFGAKGVSVARSAADAEDGRQASESADSSGETPITPLHQPPVEYRSQPMQQHLSGPTPPSGEDDDQQGDTLQDFLIRLRNTVSFYTLNYRENPIERVYLLGTGAEYPGLARMLQTEFGVPVEMPDIAHALKVPRKNAAAFAATRRRRFLVPIGTAMGVKW